MQANMEANTQANAQAFIRDVLQQLLSRNQVEAAIYQKLNGYNDVPTVRLAIPAAARCTSFAIPTNICTVTGYRLSLGWVVSSASSCLRCQQGKPPTVVYVAVSHPHHRVSRRTLGRCAVPESIYGPLQLTAHQKRR